MRPLLPLPWSRQDLSREPAADPFLSLQREIDRLFEDFTRGSFLMPRLDGGTGRVPRINVSETETALEVEVELPGIDEKDVDVSVTEDLLTIKGERKQERDEKKKDYHLVERSYGAFSRSIPLPYAIDPDQVKARFAKGILTVTLPKPPEEKSKARKIAVSPGG